ncbi:hypothetical protein [Vibrio mimicus]|uniref:hypothetical protein n=1 Tax=Vibrio mimicus TaxID=674 RepID=UPI0011D8B6FB|nr:hypothetical protein [Vibrio mimicus]TXX97134.1 hypothetical protein FXF05_20310 [Vibrio mimicus]
MNLKLESKRISKSHFELERRRLNWKVVVKEKIKTHFDELVLSAKKSNYPFLMHCKVNDSIENLESVQVTSESRCTCITEQLENGGSKLDFEKGAGLAFSLSAKGDVVVTIRPYKSEWVGRTEDSIIIKYGISPDEVTDEFIKKCIRQFLRYLRASSVSGTYGTRKYEYLYMRYLLLIDIKNRTKLLGYINKWSLLVISALLGAIFTSF